MLLQKPVVREEDVALCSLRRGSRRGVIVDVVLRGGIGEVTGVGGCRSQGLAERRGLWWHDGLGVSDVGVL